MGGKHVGIMYGCKLSIISNENVCFEMQMRLKLFERVIYRLLGGRIEALTPVCKTFADYLWAYTSCYIEQKIHSLLVYVIERKTFHLSIVRYLDQHIWS